MTGERGGMKKQFWVYLFVLVGALVFTIPVSATLGPAGDNPKPPLPGAAPTPEAKVSRN
jgi:hypothetical protein